VLEETDDGAPGPDVVPERSTPDDDHVPEPEDD
jgi:hypothetical protein